MKKIDYSGFADCKDRYLEIFDLKSLQKEWKKLYKELILRRPVSDIYPADIRDIIVADCSLLNIIYSDSPKLTQEEKASAKCIFNYDFKNNKPADKKPLSVIKKQKMMNYSIAKFFIENAEKLNITSCYYCEMNYIFPYETNKKIKRMFDLDHFFGKAECPITALSLYNFVPSCPICNSRIKGQKKLKDFYSLKNYINISKLSPSSPQYSFNNDVKIKIEPTKVGFISDLEKNSVTFETDGIYSSEIDAFELKERYNSSLIKKHALLMEELKQKWPDARIKSIVDFLIEKGENITEKDILLSIFHEDNDLDKNGIFSKLKRDILGDR
jgi:hypothetical protein